MTTPVKVGSSLFHLFSDMPLTQSHFLGYLEARTVRLPTVCIRTGAPSSAASSFISSLVREPLQGISAICPIASSATDPILDEMGIYVSRSKTVVANIALAMTLPDDQVVAHVGKLRTINLPGFRITTRQILESLQKWGGQEAFNLVSFEKDPNVIAICETWAGDYVSDRVVELGFSVDGSETGYDDAVKDFVDGIKLVT